MTYVKDEVRFRPGWRLADVEDAYITFTLDRLGGHREKTARALGISRKTLHSRLARISGRGWRELTCVPTPDDAFSPIN